MGGIPAGPFAVHLAEGPLIALDQHDRAWHAVAEHDRDLPGRPGPHVGGTLCQEADVGDDLDPLDAGEPLTVRHAVDGHPFRSDLEVVPRTKRGTHVRNGHSLPPVRRVVVQRSVISSCIPHRTDRSCPVS